MRRRGKAAKTGDRNILGRRNAAKVARRRKPSTGLAERIARLTRERDEALEQQTATSEILQAISSSPTDAVSTLEAIAESVAKLLDVPDADLMHIEGNVLRSVAKYGPAIQWPLGTTRPLSRDWVTGRAVIDRAFVHVADLQARESEFPQGAAYARQYGHRTTLAVPLLREGSAIGAILIRRMEVRPFTDKQIELVQDFAAQAVIAIENTRLLNELRQRTDDLGEALERQTATSEVLKVISSSPGELEPVFQEMMESATRICQVKFGILYRCEGDALRTVAMHGAPQSFVEERRRNPIIRPTSNTTLGRALVKKQPVQTGDILEELDKFDARAAQLPKLAGARTVLAVPIVKENELMGAILIYRQEVSPFTEKQIDLVKNFAAQAAIAIENARLLNELRSRTQELATSLNDLRTTQDRLVQTQKLASLGQLIAGIAHEMKNPLNFVNNFSSVSSELIDELQESLKDVNLADGKREEITEVMKTLRGNLDKVVQHGKRADTIVKNMLLHSHQGSGERRPVVINALVEESLKLAYHGARAEKNNFNIMVEQSFDPDAGAADISPQEVMRVLLNLISNGVYATGKKALRGGETYKPTLVASTKDLGDRVEIGIRDNGTGISPEVKENMFNPFFTTKPAGEGTGLGLSISYDIIVKQHGGSIEVETEPGEFTEIRIILPRIAAST